MVSMDILFQIKSTQWYKVIVRKLSEWLSSSEMELLIVATPQREEKRTETTAQREGITVRINRDTKYSTDGDTTISMYPYRQVSCYIQYTYNSAHKINLFSMQFQIK